MTTNLDNFTLHLQVVASRGYPKRLEFWIFDVLELEHFPSKIVKHNKQGGNFCGLWKSAQSPRKHTLTHFQQSQKRVQRNSVKWRKQMPICYKQAVTRRCLHSINTLSQVEKSVFSKNHFTSLTCFTFCKIRTFCIKQLRYL